MLQLQGGNIDNEVQINERFKIERGSFDKMTRTRFVLKSAGINDNCHIICTSKDLPVTLLDILLPCSYSIDIRSYLLLIKINCIRFKDQLCSLQLATSMVDQSFAQAAGIDIVFKRENIVQVTNERYRSGFIPGYLIREVILSIYCVVEQLCDSLPKISL